MEHTTKYDTIIDFLLNNWIIAALVVLAVIIGFIPSLRDGVVQLWNWIDIRKRNKEFKIVQEGETITFEIKTSSANFDIVKVNSLTHHLGVSAEYKWIEKFYPGFRSYQQSLKHIPVDDVKYYYDVVEIQNKKGRKKSIYFDITSFFNEHGSTSYKKDEFVVAKIKEIHKDETKL
ncbi:MAG: hypothetical protein V4638_01550 [Bacteroidota bacterium]